MNTDDRTDEADAIHQGTGVCSEKRLSSVEMKSLVDYCCGEAE